MIRRCPRPNPSANNAVENVIAHPLSLKRMSSTTLIRARTWAYAIPGSFFVYSRSSDFLYQTTTDALVALRPGLSPSGSTVPKRCNCDRVHVRRTGVHGRAGAGPVGRLPG